MAKSPLRVIPLGGLGEIGKNMMALEYEGDIIVIDCGVLFPEQDMPGVDLVIPDITYLMERKDHVKAILITHGHEDHTGALPFVLPSLPVPVYAPRLAHGLISVKLKERRGLRASRLEIAEPGTSIKLGKFGVEFFRVCHSIPDAMGLAIETPIGTVIHTGDFKIDHTPVDGKGTDMARLADYGAKGVLLLFSDSTYAETPGYTPSEKVVGEALDRAIGRPGESAGGDLRLPDLPHTAGYRRLRQARPEGGNRRAQHGGQRQDEHRDGLYLSPSRRAPSPGGDQTAAPREVGPDYHGKPGELTSALVRIANGDHRDIRVIPGDTVIISATPIPGNETVVSRTIDNLTRQGARVLYDKLALVHVHGHGSQEELKMMLSITKPRFFIPVHGEYRHLMAHAALARTMGVPEPGIHVLEDGDILELTYEGAEIVGSTPANHVYIDGQHIMGVTSPVLSDRRSLSRDGIVVVVVALDRATGMPARPPELVSRGSLDQEQMEGAFQRVSASLAESLTNKPDHPIDWALTNARVREEVSRLLYKATGRSPVVVPVALEV